MTQDTSLGWALLSGHELVFLCAHRLHLAPPTPPTNLLLPAAYLAGPSATPPLPPPTTGLPPACLLQGPDLGSCPIPPAFVPSSFFPESQAWLATPPSQSRSPPCPHTQCVPLICLRVELKGQISKKSQLWIWKESPRGPERATSEGTGGGQLSPARQNTPRAGVCPRLTAAQGPGRNVQKEVSLSHTHRALSLPLSLSLSSSGFSVLSLPAGVFSWSFYFLPSFCFIFVAHRTCQSPPSEQCLPHRALDALKDLEF